MRRGACPLPPLQRHRPQAEKARRREATLHATLAKYESGEVDGPFELRTSQRPAKRAAALAPAAGGPTSPPSRDYGLGSGGDDGPIASPVRRGGGTDAPGFPVAGRTVSLSASPRARAGTVGFADATAESPQLGRSRARAADDDGRALAFGGSTAGGGTRRPRASLAGSALPPGTVRLNTAAVLREDALLKARQAAQAAALAEYEACLHDSKENDDAAARRARAEDEVRRRGEAGRQGRPLGRARMGSSHELVLVGGLPRAELQPANPSL